MEALTAVQIALLTIYDMCKAVDRGMSLQDIRLVEKRGGKSGHWQRAPKHAKPQEPKRHCETEAPAARTNADAATR